jgi:hypothetical protein
MKNKQTINMLAFSLIGFGIGYILTNSTMFNLCLHDQYACRALLNRIGDPLFYGIGALAIVFFILLFASYAFSAWKKFAIWFVPLATLLFIFYPEPGSGDLFSPYPEQVFKWISGLYVLISVVIIAIVSLRKPKYPTH